MELMEIGRTIKLFQDVSDSVSTAVAAHFDVELGALRKLFFHEVSGSASFGAENGWEWDQRRTADILIRNKYVLV
jgi:hypothetical protein